MTVLPKWDPEGAPKKPQIVGIGAQKAGTTWLGQMIAQHPQVWLPPFKEAQFFNHRFVPEHRQWLPWHFRRARQNQEKRYAGKGQEMPPELDAWLKRITTGEMFTNRWYKQVFAPAPEGTIPCDITPEYSTLPEEGVDFVADFLPKGRFIYIIRHPVDRAISQLKMNLTRKKKHPKGVEAWLAEIDDPVLYDRGDYATYVPRWTSRLPQDRLLILPFGQIARDPEGFMRRIEGFCGLDPFGYRDLGAKVFAANGELSFPAEARAKIRERLEPQFAFIEKTFGKEFSALIR
ncbi:sulfotransferase [Paracoccus sp. MC1854]|uniref:sulfotransferase family protein n=1 Tax=Paracoccus sp. MC1854 TaxID=2760306 RepID=UPI00351BF9F8